MIRILVWAMALSVMTGAVARAADSCYELSGEASIAACTADIDSGTFSGYELATKYNNLKILHNGLTIFF